MHGRGEDLTLTVAAVAADGLELATATLALRILDDAPATEGDGAATALPAPGIETSWEVPPTAEPGRPLDVLLRCRFDADVTDGAIRPVLAAARYVAGSTRVNGHALVDGPSGPPLFAAAGLALHDIPARSEVAIGWSVVADGSGPVTLDAIVAADGAVVSSAGPRVGVDGLAPFVERPDGLAFHIDAATLLHPPIALGAAPPGPRATGIRFGLRLDALRRTTILRMLSGTAGGGIVAHLPLLAALFPDTVDDDDPQLADALALAAESVRSVYERLFVKLRIPGYDVGPYDLEDASTRSALSALLERAARTEPGGVEPFAAFSVTLDRVELHDARTRLAAAPLGGVDAVATAALLLPRTGDDPAAHALGSYAALIAHELEAARSLSHDAFAAYLTMHAIDTLEHARRAAIAALAPATAREPA